MNSKENELGIIGNFSVALGLFDYINPIFYGVTVITILIKMFGIMSVPTYILFAVGAVISLIFGLSIPTVKIVYLITPLAVITLEPPCFFADFF